MDVIKAHGTGNDFVVVVDLDDRLEVAPALVQALCDRRTGIGADGLIRIGAPRTGGDVFMDYRNADGSVVEMCGNGVRVVAKTVVDRGLVAPRDGGVVDVDTRDGVKPVEVRRGEDGRVTEVTVDMGPPHWSPDEIPVDLDDAHEFQLDVAPDLTWSAVSMGNPHAITRVDDVATAPVVTVGPQVERHRAFPKGTNVEFAHVVAHDLVELRVWERGVGETQACGTGACATFAVLRADGLLGDRAVVRVPGGDLVVSHDPDRHPSVFLTGPAEEVATATLDAAWLAVRGLPSVPGGA
jgi:diaminopimelate epimerase